MRLPRPALLPFIVCVPLFAAGDPASGYQEPSAAVTAVLTARPTPSVLVSPRHDVILLREREGLVTIAELAEPELRLAGLRFNPVNASPTRRQTISSLRLVALDGSGERAVSGLPSGARLDFFDFSPDGNRVAFANTTESGTELWVLDISTARARRLAPTGLNAAAGKPFSWLPDSNGLVALLLPAQRGAEPIAPAAPTAPVIEETRGRRVAARTYQDLLRNAHDEALLEYHLAAQAARIGLDGSTVMIGSPGLITDLDPSPDGEWILGTVITKPFSRVVPLHRFGRRVEAWPAGGGAPVTIAELDVSDNEPSGADSVRPGRRTVGWRADAPATVWWVEARDRGDPANEARIRDEVSMLPAPFDGQPTSIARLPKRFGGITWGDGSLAVVTESWRKTRGVRILAVDPSHPAQEPRVWFEYSSQDRYANPGAFVTVQNAAGRSVLKLDPAGSLFLIGDGATKEGDLPFVDRYNPATGGSTRLFQSGTDLFERPVSLLDESGARLLTSRETVTMQPNYHVRDGAGLHPVTHFPHPYPELEGVTKELVRAVRGDGIEISATLWLPAGWSAEKGALPTVLWAYPREFLDPDDAGQVIGSPNQFTRINPNRLTWLVLAGYAVLDEASMPVVGRDGAEPNDTFVKQIVMNARAIIDEAARRGVTDPARVGVGGHSYGAFMTANLLAHCDLFRAGIARSGAYNRTLTPFGFQGEQRTFWEAPEIYATLSPFHAATGINAPILLVHGAADNNSGTFPIQTERLFAALRGLGKTARYVQLPLESHGYASRESILHVAWESQRWLDLHVKGGGPGSE